MNVSELARRAGVAPGTISPDGPASAAQLAAAGIPTAPLADH